MQTLLMKEAPVSPHLPVQQHWAEHGLEESTQRRPRGSVSQKLHQVDPENPILLK